MKPLPTLTVAVLFGIAAAGGCSKDSKEASPSAHSDAGHVAEKKHDHEHDHPATGPHNGQLIELGKEEYHGELVHDDAAGTVTIYLLDNQAKESVAIEATELRINLKHGKKGEQFELAAAPQERDPKGKSSRFVSKDKELSTDLDLEGAEARLVVEIDGKSFTGEITHSHDEDGHDLKK